MRTSLLKALRTVHRKDSWSFRQAVFDDLSSRRPLIRAARALHAALGDSRPGAALIAGYALGSYLGVRPPPGEAPLLAVCAYRNEARQLDWVEGLLGPGAMARVGLDPRAALSREGAAALLALAAHPRDLRRGLSLIRRVNAGGNFLVACRVASTLGYYARFRRLLARHPARAVLVSSDSNPYAMGAVGAARALGLGTAYIPHGHIPDGPPPLDFDLSLLDGPALRRVYEASGPTRGTVVYKGAEGVYRPMCTEGLRRDRLRIGVFLSLITDWDALAAELADLRARLRPEHLLIRLHPNRVVRPRNVAALLGAPAPGLSLSLGESVLLDDARGCDVVYAGNSSCHLTLLKYGVPTVYTRGLDKVPHDFYRFLAEGIVPELDRAGDLDPAALAAFYEEPGWAERFASFDASYRRDQAALDRAVLDALRALLR